MYSDCQQKPVFWRMSTPIAQILCFLLCLLLLAGLSARAETYLQAPLRLRLSEYQKQNWQVEDGLPESNVRQIAQAPDGRLLLATFSGVLTFDGQRFGTIGGIQNQG